MGRAVLRYYPPVHDGYKSFSKLDPRAWAEGRTHTNRTQRPRWARGYTPAELVPMVGALMTTAVPTNLLQLIVQELGLDGVLTVAELAQTLDALADAEAPMDRHYDADAVDRTYWMSERGRR